MALQACLRREIRDSCGAQDNDKRNILYMERRKVMQFDPWFGLAVRNFCG